VLKYFQDKILTKIPIILGIIKHARQIDDYQSIREYLLKITKIYMERGDYENAFREICDVIEVDFSNKMELAEKDRKKDLKLLLDTSEWTTHNNVPLKLKRIIREMPDCAERHLIIGSFFLTLEKYKLARDRLEKAYEKAITGRMKAFILLKLGKVYFFQENFKKVKACLNELEKYQLTDDLMIMFIELKSLYFGFTGKLSEAINIIEEFLPTIKSQNDANYFIKLGSLHNNLAVFLHRERHYEEAEKNFRITRKIWEKVNYRRKLAAVLNNLGDVNLTKGNTKTAVKYFTEALDICSKVDCKRNRILGLLNLGEANIKLGRFDTAEKFLHEALRKSEEQENKPFFDAIINNLAIAKSKIHDFSYYQKFITENVPGLAKGNIYKVTPLTKTYFYYLHQIGDYEKIEKLLEKSESIFLEKKENEFYYQMYGFLLLNKGEYEKAIEVIELAFEYSKQMQSVYAQAINYIRLNECYLAVGDVQKATEMHQKAEYLCDQNDFNYWKKVLALRKIKLQLLDEKISFRKIIRELLAVIEYVQKNNLYLLEIESYEIIIQIYAHLNINKKAKLFFGRYKKKIENATHDLPEYDRNIYMNKTNYYIADYSHLKTLKIAERTFFVSENWQEELYDILKLKELTRIKFFIEKTIDKLLDPFYFSIILSDEIKNKKTPFLTMNIEDKKLFNAKFLNNINNSLDNNLVLSKRIMGSNVLFIPLRIKTAKVGCFVIGDKGELEFQKDEISVLKILRFHLTSILMRINEFAELNNYMELMTKLMKITRKFFMILDLDKLEQEVVSFTLDFIGGTRGFLIRKDKYENYVYKIALDDSKHLLKKYAFISKTVLSEVQKTRKPIFIQDTKESKIFDGYVNFDQSSLNIYCAPLIVDDHDFGFLYIDNFNSDSIKIEINEEFMKLLLMQIVVSLKNALQYESLRQKNKEVESLDNLKNDFINIVSHELKTPLVTLHGYVNRMQKPGNYQFHEEDIRKISKSVDKLYLTTEDIINFNKYKLLNEINKNITNIKDILQVVVDELENLVKDRHMFFKLEIEDKLPSIEVNWEAFTLLLKNLILNAVRFTKDFGTVTVGARHSAFQQEEVEGQESLIVFIQDNGIGIPENELENVFRKFYELNDLYAHKSGTTEFRSSGLGLGLSTAKLIVKLHNGKIWLNSKENEGTTVFIAIPIKD
ncbi:MAG TPA: tetratricopeptide repeat protein, partial [Candidatus Cloacimonetes bacterium]|nr:tetratricopeptide repeat protein [Candidatus Cloacimonadota bacterium]